MFQIFIDLPRVANGKTSADSVNLEGSQSV
jgi:hypothetical protein